MDHENLMGKIRRIRKARVDAMSAVANKPTRQARPKKDPLETLLKNMSPEEREAFIKLMQADED